MRFMFLNHSYKRHSAELEAHIVELLRSYASPDTTFELAYPEDLGGGEVLSLLEERKALSGLHHILETPALVKKAIEAEQRGFDAVIQSNTFDPGVEASRLAVRIPVIGLLRASLHFTASICDRFGLIVPLETHMPHTLRLVQTYGMAPFVCGIRTVGLYDTGDLSGYHDAVIERTLAVGKELVQQGAEAIIPLGGKIGAAPGRAGDQHQGGGRELRRADGAQQDQAQPQSLSVPRGAQTRGGVAAQAMSGHARCKAKKNRKW